MNKNNTLEWQDGTLLLLDQRRLPHTVAYVTCRDAEDTARAIRDMVVRGAPAIGCAAAYGIALEALRLDTQPAGAFRAGISHAIDTLAASRPTAINLFWALNRMRALLDHNPTATALLHEAHAITREDIAANHAMGAHGAALLADGARVLTHCNAGALATAGHGTALGVVRSAVGSGKKIHVYADETRPFLQGARLTAWELQQDGIPVTLIADNAAGYLMSRGEIDGIIVGADRVAANGDVANKIGTYSVAVLARRHGLPFYVVAPISSIDLTLANGALITIEEREAEEVTHVASTHMAPTGIAVRNPVFDVTPAELVTALITERGVLHAPDTASVKSLALR